MYDFESVFPTTNIFLLPDQMQVYLEHKLENYLKSIQIAELVETDIGFMLSALENLLTSSNFHLEQKLESISIRSWVVE